MKIFFIGDAGSVHVQRWVKYFADKGHKVYLFSFETLRGSSPLSDNIVLHYLIKIKLNIKLISSLINLLLNIKLIKDHIKKTKPDVIHAHFISMYGWLGALVRYFPLVVTAWGSDVLVHPQQSKKIRLLTSYALKTASLVTTDAEHMKKPLIELGTDPKKIEIVGFGTDIDKFNPNKRNNVIREGLRISNCPTIISLRSLNPIYDIETLILSASRVLKEYPSAKFLIAGKGSEEVKLKILAKSLKISDSVRFLGQIPQENLPQYISSADIYVSTSLSDAGIASSTAEAMACGLPVIITDFGDNRKWVKNGINGFIIPLKSPDILAEKIIYLMKNKNDREKFGKANRKVIEERNNWEKEMGKMDKLYKKLVKKYT